MPSQILFQQNYPTFASAITIEKHQIEWNEIDIIHKCIFTLKYFKLLQERTGAPERIKWTQIKRKETADVIECITDLNHKLVYGIVWDGRDLKVHSICFSLFPYSFLSRVTLGEYAFQSISNRSNKKVLNKEGKLQESNNVRISRLVYFVGNSLQRVGKMTISRA